MIRNKLTQFIKPIATRCLATESKGSTTSLYDFHVEKGGKIVNFGGFLLPVQYNDLSITNSHLHTRKNASLFDVSHMLQTEVVGKDCIEFFEKLCTADIGALKENASVLTVFTNENGGILDDLIITKINDNHLYIVSNAGRKEHDQQLMLEALQKHKRATNSEIEMKFYEPKERSLLALQGPRAAEVLQNLTQVDLSKLYFMNSSSATVAGVDSCRITRCGYTGEDGFEISLPAVNSKQIANELLNSGTAKLAGLGARDSLRLEAGLCLYGSDITDEVTPIEAGLTWLVAKTRRERKDFPGADKIVGQIKDGVGRKRIGLLSTGPPARHNALIFNESGDQQVGLVTSGCPAPSIGKNVAMGYVSKDFAKIGTKLNLKIRDKLYETIITKMPFVKANYYNKPK